MFFYNEYVVTKKQRNYCKTLSFDLFKSIIIQMLQSTTFVVLR